METARKTQIRNIVNCYKTLNHKTMRITEWAENNMNDLIEQFGYEELMDIVNEVQTEDIWSVLNPTFIKFYTSQKEQSKAQEVIIEEQAQKIEKKKKLDIEAEQSTLSLGLVEKALARVMVEEYSPVLADSVFKKASEYIEQEYGKIVKTVKYVMPEHGELDEVTHEEFETVLSFVMANEPVMLVGPAGTGKNVICKQVAKILGLDFYFSNAVTQEYKLTGFIDANGTYQETEFYKAFKNGGVFMLDEIDASIPEVLVILNAAIANRYFDFPNGKIEAHKDFRVVAAGNTYGHGASYQYVGRNQLDGASLDRFAQVVIDYSPRIEEALTKDQSLLKFIRKFRSECTSNGLNHIVSYRTITRLDKMSQVMSVDKILKTCLIKNMESDDLNMIVRHFGGSDKWSKGLKQVAEQMQA